MAYRSFLARVWIAIVAAGLHHTRSKPHLWPMLHFAATPDLWIHILMDIMLGSQPTKPQWEFQQGLGAGPLSQDKQLYLHSWTQISLYAFLCSSSQKGRNRGKQVWVKPEGTFFLSRNNGHLNETPRPIAQSIDLCFSFPSYFQFIVAINTLVHEISWSIMISRHFWPEAELCNLNPPALSSTRMMLPAWLLVPKWHLIIFLIGGLMVILLNRGLLSEVFVKWFKTH